MLGVLAWKERSARDELHCHATKAPNIDLPVVGLLHQDFRSPVKPALNVSMDSMAFETSRAHVYKFHGSSLLTNQKDILRLYITMDDSLLLQKSQGLEGLVQEFSRQLQTKSSIGF